MGGPCDTANPLFTMSCDKCKARQFAGVTPFSYTIASVFSCDSYLSWLCIPHPCPLIRVFRGHQPPLRTSPFHCHKSNEFAGFSDGFTQFKSEDFPQVVLTKGLTNDISPPNCHSLCHSKCQWAVPRELSGKPASSSCLSWSSPAPSTPFWSFSCLSWLFQNA